MTSPYDKSALDALKRVYLGTPDEAVFLERARIIHMAARKYSDLPPLIRQARIIGELCRGLSVIVSPCDVFLGRIREEVPSPRDEEFIREHPELFVEAGVPGVLDSMGIYCPDWRKLLDSGIGGLIEETRCHEALLDLPAPPSAARAEFLGAVRISLEAVCDLARRFASEAEKVAASAAGADVKARLTEAAQCCAKIALAAPDTFREALQLFILYHTVLSSVIGARNVTPGRMDQYLFQFYENDLAQRRLTRAEAVEFVAAVMVMLSQGSGKISTDFQSTKRTPNKHSHYYITLGGAAGGRCASNDLSFVIMEAQSLAGLREPSIEIRHSPGIDKTFWREALRLMRDGRPAFVYNDEVIVAALMREGVPHGVASDYVHAGCMNVLLPGHGNPTLRDNINVPLLILSVINGGRNPVAGQPPSPTASAPSGLGAFDAFFDALRDEIRSELGRKVAWYETISRRLPLPARPLFEGHIEKGFEYWENGKVTWDVHMTGVATAVDSLLAVRQAVYRDKTITLEKLRDALAADFKGHEALRRVLSSRIPSYGSDEPEVLDMIERLGRMWVDEVEAAAKNSPKVALRPGFHSWLFNIDDGKRLGATPDGRRAGEFLSSDFLPAAGKGHTPTASLRCMARLPHGCAPSGGTTFGLDASHFQGDAGLDRLSALIEGYFAEGGNQLHFIFADAATLSDAVEYPEKHSDLLVRVTGFSEYFVRLLPEVQQDIIRRARGFDSRVNR